MTAAAVRLVMARAMTEDQLLAAVTDAATLYGWRWYHVRRSDKALTMGAPGFPDLILSRGTAMLAIELKTERGRLTVDQAEWLGAFGRAGVEYLVVRPRNLDTVLTWLR